MFHDRCGTQRKIEALRQNQKQMSTQLAERAEEEYSIRRSTRRKRNRSEWSETLVMSVRTRSKGGQRDNSVWKQIVRLTTTAKKPNGIIGSFRLLSKSACPSLVGACISQCSCPHCTTFLENLDHRHVASQCGWRKTSVCVPVPVDVDISQTSKCSACGGDCHDAQRAI